MTHSAMREETPLDISLREELLARMLAEWGDAHSIRERLRMRVLRRDDLHLFASGILRTLLAGMRNVEAYQQPMWQSRLTDLVLDVLESEALAPPLRLPIVPQQLPNTAMHALIFSAFPQVTNELYALLVDAYTSGRRPAVGVHERWLCGDTIRRAIYLDEETLALVESDLLDAPPMASAQVLALDLREERAAHQRIEQAIHVSLWNPSAGAARLDDKSWTGACWLQAGLPTPRFCRLDPAWSDAQMQETIAAIAGNNPSLILKPMAGTEGQGVQRLSEDSISALASIQQVTKAGSWLLMEERGTVRYTTPDGPVPCVLRLNVCWDGHDAQAESSFAQIAASHTGIASVGQGGRLIATTELWTHLCDARGASFHPQVTDWRRIIDVAQCGVRALSVPLGKLMPALVGLDILLDFVTDGSLCPVLLEANARPAGMGHSHYITADGPGDEPGVTAKLWQRV
jgi:hypothetical protein